MKPAVDPVAVIVLKQLSGNDSVAGRARALVIPDLCRWNHLSRSARLDATEVISTRFSSSCAGNEPFWPTGSAALLLWGGEQSCESCSKPGSCSPYYLNLLHDLCTGYSPRVKGSGFSATLVGIVLAALLGVVVAFPLAGFALRLAYSRRLAGLPISPGQRLRAASVFGGSLGGGHGGGTV